MATHLLLVLCNSKPGLDEEFVHWYQGEHLPWTVQTLPGVTSGQQYSRAPIEASLPPYKYLAIYQVDDSRLEETIARFAANRVERAAEAAAGRTSMLTISPAMDTSDSIVGFFAPLGETVHDSPSAS